MTEEEKLEARLSEIIREYTDRIKAQEKEKYIKFVFENGFKALSERMKEL